MVVAEAVDKLRSQRDTAYRFPDGETQEVILFQENFLQLLLGIPELEGPPADLPGGQVNTLVPAPLPPLARQPGRSVR